MSAAKSYIQNWKPQGVMTGYSSEPSPLGSYAFLIGAYGLMLFSLNKVARTKSKRLKRIKLRDILLLLPAVHKLSRIITKDWVTSPLRAPFTEYQGHAGAGELKERARGSGMQKALGDLLTCQYCIGPWVSAILVYSMAGRPRETRLFATVFAIVAGSDFMHLGYQSARAKQEHLSKKAAA